MRTQRAKPSLRLCVLIVFLLYSVYSVIKAVLYYFLASVSLKNFTKPSI